MKEKLISWQERIRATTSFKVFIELVFWGIILGLWTLTGELLSAYFDVFVYIGYFIGAVAVTASAIRIYNYFQTIKNNIKK